MIIPKEEKKIRRNLEEWKAIIEKYLEENKDDFKESGKKRTKQFV